MPMALGTACYKINATSEPHLQGFINHWIDNRPQLMVVRPSSLDFPVELLAVYHPRGEMMEIDVYNIPQFNV